MDSNKLKIFINLFSSSSEKIAIVDDDLNVLWSTGIALPQKLERSDFFDVSNNEYQDYGFVAEFPIKSEKILQYETHELVCSVNVLSVFDDNNRDKTEGYILTFYSFFEEIKHINSSFSIALKKFLRMLRSTASDVYFNTKLIDQRLEDLEEYDLVDKNANINKVLDNALSSCANFEEALIYGADDFNIILSDASEFVNDLMHFVKHSAKAKRINVEFTYKIENDIYLKLDYSRFLVAIMNLISNGIKYNISEHKNICVEFYKADNYAYFIVTDNGMGISNDKAFKIYEPFSNINKVGMRESLGLAIVKRFVDKFDGRIECKTGISGTSFTLMLPCEEATDKNEVEIPNTDYFRGSYSPIDIYLLKATSDEDID